MSTQAQGGIKQVATVPARLDSKRDRRRGGAGRASALRRAPSDSDCSAETASLSADSGDRAPRPLPPPPPSSSRKRGSRRRGSEWEVLEGLKDGQRFEKRPEVFNGYLHKKRKWPLKGWHKRFFVVDGGILVYARSPTDLARGRLQGSVDVGLSVISAIARRRRIDIDADEFIYHLRAKTPDLFRTWLNVLKAHRLYRQHLLTFGMRESAPKVHPPLDDLPATDTSSRSSYSSITLSSCSEDSFPDDTQSEPVNYKYISQIHLHKYSSQHDNSKNKKHSYVNDLNECYDDYISIQCKKQSNENLQLTSCPESYGYNQKNDYNPYKTTIVANPVMIQHKMHKETKLIASVLQICKPKRVMALNRYDDRNSEPISTYFLFKKNRSDKIGKETSSIQPSKKSINLPKFRLHKEPGLKRPLSKCLLEHIELNDEERRKKLISEFIPTNSNDIEAIVNETKKTEDLLSKKQLEDITEKLLASLKKTSDAKNPANITKSYVADVIKDLYDVTLQRHPIKLLFRSLLEYWVKENIKIKASLVVKPKTQSKDTQSEFTSEVINPKKETKAKIFKSQETQCYKLGNITRSLVKGKQETKYSRNITQSLEKIPVSDKDHIMKEKTKAKEIKPSVHKISLGDLRRNPSSFERDKRIQDIERLLENTIYSNDTMRSNNKENKISITKTILDRLKSEQLDVTSFDTYEEAIKQLSQSDSIPNYVVKEILTICLDVLSHDSFKLLNKYGSKTNNNPNTNFCEKSLIVGNVVNKTPKQFINQENTTNFAFGNKKKLKKAKEDEMKNEMKEEIKREEEIIKTDVVDCKANVVLENRDKNALYISLSKYDLNSVSMNKHPTVKDSISISIQLKEKPRSTISSRANLRLTLNNTCGSSFDQLLANCQQSAIFKTEHPVYYIESTTKLDKKQENEPKVLDSDGTSKSYCKIMYPTKYAESNNVFNKQHSSGYKSGSNYNNVNSYEDRNYTCCVLKSSKYGAKNIPHKMDGNMRNRVIRVPKEVGFKVNSFENNNQKLILDNLNILSQTLPRFREDIHTLMNRLPQLKSTSTNTPYSPENGIGFLIKEGHKHFLIDTQNASVEANLINKSYSHGNNTKEVFIVHPENLVDRAASALALPKLPTTLSKAVSALKLDVEPKKWFDLVRCPIEVMNIKGTCYPYSLNVTKTTVDASVQYIKEHLTTTNRSVNTSTKLVLQKLETHHSYKPIILEYRNPIRKIDSLSDSIQSSKSILPHTGSYKRDLRRNYQIHQMSGKKNKLGPMRSSSSSENCSDEFGFRRRIPLNGFLSPSLPTLRGPQAGFVSGTPGGRLAGWIVESGGPLETVSREITQAQLSVQQLRRLLEQLELQLPPHHHDTDVSLEGASPNVKSSRRKFGLRKKKSSTKCASVELQPPMHLEHTGSHTALSTLTAPPSPGGGASSVPNSATSLPIACAAARPQSLPAAEAGPASLASLTPPTDVRLREDFTVLAKDLVHSCQCILSTLVCERNRLRVAMEEQNATPTGGVMSALRTNLSTALQQNSDLHESIFKMADQPGFTNTIELRSRLSRIHDASDLAEISSMNDAGNHKFQQSLSYSSSCVSASEFFDAEEHEEAINKDLIAADEAGVIELDGDSTSEAGSLSSEDGSASSDNSDAASTMTPAVVVSTPAAVPNGALQASGRWSRRSTLPAPRPAAAGPSLWHLLYKNIGKDLSQISMPVTINEPLNMLQRLCEELEYSELLDAACGVADPVERMCCVAAFAVSAYAGSAARAASKPFNPLLHETYECVRDDRSFRFLAEQVSHHPPVSACHASSPRWVFWQDARIKTKFWGKSMEFQPTGNVHLRLLNTGDHYTWNKVTTCVHNLFGGQRWVDQYGDMVINCLGSDIQCKLHFIKASSWSQSRHEVSGAVSGGGAGGGGGAVRLRGRWSEALYCGEPAARCLWRRAAMPPDYELYYGFTQFAMELNELEPGMKDILPHTDTRLRPDQRALECGDIEAAEQYKMELEQAQRDRRRDVSNRPAAWFRRVVENGEESWVFTGEYWKAREIGFSEDIAPRLW